MSKVKIFTGRKYRFRVKDDDVIGTLKFDGNKMKITGKKGIWYGFEVAEDFKKFGKNNGTINGVSYMKVKSGYGVFVKQEKVIEIVSGKAGTKSKAKIHKAGALETGRTKLSSDSLVAERYSVDAKEDSDLDVKMNRKYVLLNKTGQEVVGTVRFIGRTDFSPRGVWYGVELASDYKGLNNGNCQGKTYFKCAPGQGMFVRKKKILEAASARAGSTRKEKIHKAGALETGRNESLDPDSVVETKKFKIMQPEPTLEPKMNKKYVIDHEEQEVVGSVKFIGRTDFAPRGIWYGVELTVDFKGQNNGSMKGRPYFNCDKKGQGIFVRQKQFLRLATGRAGTSSKAKEHKVGAIETGKSSSDFKAYGSDMKTIKDEKAAPSELEPVKGRKYVVLKEVNHVKTEVVGTVKYIGKTFFKPGRIWYGVELAVDYKGDNNGSKQGTSYFTCDVKGQGYFCLKKHFVREASGREGEKSKEKKHKAGAIETGRNDYHPEPLGDEYF